MYLDLSNYDPNPNRQHSFFSNYECEAVIPLEIQMPSLRVALETKTTKEDNNSLLLQKLEALDEKRIQAQQRIELYQARISKAFNKKVKRGYSKKEIWF